MPTNRRAPDRRLFRQCPQNRTRELNLRTASRIRRAVGTACIGMLIGCDQPHPLPADSLDRMLAEAPLVEVEQELVVGLTEDPRALLAGPMFIGTDDDGFIYILDHLPREIQELKRYTPTGEFESVVILGGDGRFNWLKMLYFRQPPGIWIEEDSRIGIWNPPSAEVLTFERDGSLVSRVSLARIAEQVDQLHVFGVYRDGYLAHFETASLEGRRTHRPKVRSGYLRVSRDGLAVDTLWSDYSPAFYSVVYDGMRRREVLAMATPMPQRSAESFAQRGLLEIEAPDPSNGDTGTIVFREIGPITAARVRAMSYRPVELQVDEVLDRMLSRVRERLSRSAVRDYERTLSIPRFVPPMVNVRTFPDESIWIRIARNSAEILSVPEAGAMQEYLVLGWSDVEPVRVRLRADRSFWVDHSGRIWIAEQTAIGEPFIAAYGIRR